MFSLAFTLNERGSISVLNVGHHKSIRGLANIFFRMRKDPDTVKKQ